MIDRFRPGSSVSIPAGANRLEIHYTALSLIAPQRLRFRYQLEGSDARWVEAGHDRTAHYTHLAPGRYTFRVLACNNDGVWNEAGAILALTVLPQFSQTLWFRLAAIALLVAVLASLVWLRVRQMNRRQEMLKSLNIELDQRVRERTAELSRSNEELRQRELEQERLHQQLLDVSRQAGMAEVATNVLHNVGNVLTSVNTSISLLLSRVQNSHSTGISKVADLFEQHRHDLTVFLGRDNRLEQLLTYLKALDSQLAGEQSATLSELQELTKNVDHIKDIVAMQQNYARVSGVIETVKVAELVDDALGMQARALARPDVQVFRDYDPQTPMIPLDRHKLLQILVNLIHNAKYACDESGRLDKQLTVRVSYDDDHVRIAVADNGVGIPTENLTRIFNHGFTTRKNGHGFGLHSAALAAQEMGGSLMAQSDGPGRGATFIIELAMNGKRETSSPAQPSHTAVAP